MGRKRKPFWCGACGEKAVSRQQVWGPTGRLCPGCVSSLRWLVEATRPSFMEAMKGLGDAMGQSLNWAIAGTVSAKTIKIAGVMPNGMFFYIDDPLPASQTVLPSQRGR